MQEAFCQLLNAEIGNGDSPAIQNAVVFHVTMRNRQMFGFENKLEHQPFRRPLHYSETNRIGNTVTRQSRAGVGIAEIAGFQFDFTELNEFAPGNTTGSPPCCTEGQPGRMR